MIRDLINFDSYGWTNWGVLGLSLLTFLFVAPVVTQAQDVEQQVETNRQLINSLYDQLNEEELKFYGFFSTSYRSNQGADDGIGGSGELTDRSAFEAGKLGLFLEKSVSDKVRIAGELFVQNGITIQNDPSYLVSPGSPSDADISGELLEASYYFIEYQDDILGTFKGGKYWKPYGLRNEIGNNAPALRTLGLSHFYGQPGTLTYPNRSGAGIFYSHNLDFLDNPFLDAKVDLNVVNGRESPKRFHSDGNSFKDHGGRLTLSAENPGTIGLDSLDMAFSAQYGKSQIGAQGEDEIFYYSLKGSRGPLSFIYEYEELRKFSGPGTFGTIAYGDLLYNLTSNTTVYYRGQEWSLGGGDDYWDDIVGVTHDMHGMTLKLRAQDRRYDGAGYEDYTQYVGQAVVPF